VRSPPPPPRATHLEILSRGHAAEALAWIRKATAKVGVALNEAKTAIREARRERFDFLGYRFGPHHYRKDGHWYLGASPSTSVARLKVKVRHILVPGNIGTWPEVRDRLNRLFAQLEHIFRLWHPGCRRIGRSTTTSMTAVRHFLVRRNKVPSPGIRRFSREAVFGGLRILHLRASIWDRRRVPRDEAVGKPDAANPHVRFDERGRETDRHAGTGPVLDSTRSWYSGA
jgi:RNA-directed DNA polymerase